MFVIDLEKATKKNYGTWKGLQIIAIGPRKGKIVGYSKGKPIYAGSSQAEKLVRKEKKVEKLEERKEIKRAVGWPQQKGNVRVLYPGRVISDSTKWKKGYPGPGYRAEVVYKGKLHTISFVEDENKKMSVHVVYPDGSSKNWGSPNKACDSLYLFDKKLDLNMSGTEKKKRGICQNAKKTFGILAFEEELKVAVKEPTKEEIKAVKTEPRQAKEIVEQAIKRQPKLIEEIKPDLEVKDINPKIWGEDFQKIEKIDSAKIKSYPVGASLHSMLSLGYVAELIKVDKNKWHSIINDQKQNEFDDKQAAKAMNTLQLENFVWWLNKASIKEIEPIETEQSKLPAKEEKEILQPEEKIEPPPSEPKKEGGRKVHLEVGEHVYGSRADKAALLRSSADLKNMTNAEARKFAVLKKMLPEIDVESEKATGSTPGKILMHNAMRKAVVAKAPDNHEGRVAYVDGIDYMEKSLSRCKTKEDVMEFIEEWSKKIEGIKFKDSIPLEEYKKAKEERYHMPGVLVFASEKYGRDVASASINHKTGKIDVYVQDPDLSMNLKENPYAKYAAAMGVKMAKILGASVPEWSGPKHFRDAWRQSKTLDSLGGETAWSKVQEAIGPKKRGKQTKKPFRWKQEVTGKPERIGGKPVKQADAEAMAKEFNIPNIQFGQSGWISDEDAEHHLKACHGALRDLSELVGIKPEKISLQGRVSLGIGARGSGSARAHYEPSKKIINLTKFSGGGTVAHEWIHAVDNILAEVYSGKTSRGDALFVSSGDGLANTGSKLRDSVRGVMAAIKYQGGQDHSAKRDELWQKVKKGQGDMSYKEWKELQSEYTQAARTAARAKPTQYLRDARAIAGKNQKSYWTRDHEMFARAFESYIQDKLENNGRRNSYLVDGTREKYGTNRYTSNENMEKGIHAQPYPHGEDRKQINRAFDNLLKVLKEERHLEKALRLEKFLLKIG